MKLECIQGDQQDHPGLVWENVMKPLSTNEQMIREQVNKIAKLEKERHELHRKLRLSLEIQELCPEAFSSGPCRTKLIDENGKSSHSFRSWNKLYRQKKLFVRITTGNGKFFDINAELVSNTILKNHGFDPDIARKWGWQFGGT